MSRVTGIPFREWPWHARVIEKLYRLTHGGRIRTLVIMECDINSAYPRIITNAEYGKSSLDSETNDFSSQLIAWWLQRENYPAPCGERVFGTARDIDSGLRHHIDNCDECQDVLDRNE